MKVAGKWGVSHPENWLASRMARVDYPPGLAEEIGYLGSSSVSLQAKRMAGNRRLPAEGACCSWGRAAARGSGEMRSLATDHATRNMRASCLGHANTRSTCSLPGSSCRHH